MRGTRAQQVLDDLLPATRRDVGIGECFTQLVGTFVRAGEAEQLVFDLAENVLGPRHLEHRIGVRADAVESAQSA